jgi:hypothetical protein
VAFAVTAKVPDRVAPFVGAVIDTAIVPLVAGALLPAETNPAHPALNHPRLRIPKTNSTCLARNLAVSLVVRKSLIFSSNRSKGWRDTERGQQVSFAALSD